MKQLKNKILIKVNRKLIFIFSISIIVALNLFGQERIEFRYYYYTNKLYHSTLKTEIIPSEYVFMTTSSNKDYNAHENLYLYNLKTKEKKLFYVNKSLYNHHGYDIYREYYDINGNLTTNWTDTNMHANGLYEITNNRFGETFYNQKINTPEGYNSDNVGYGIVKITKENEYIQKAYKYSLTQPEIINKKDRGIYLFKRQYDSSYSEILYTLCFQNEYYKNGFHGDFGESELLNYNSNGRIVVHVYDNMTMASSYSAYDGWRKKWITNTGGGNYATNIVYFQLDNKSLIKPTWNEFTNDFLNYRKLKLKGDIVFYTKENIEKNRREYSVITDTKYLGFIPIEEFEYYLK